MKIQNVNREEYVLIEQVDSEFEVRGKEVSHVYTTFVCKKGVDKGMVLRVVNVRHYIQFCKAMNFHHGYKVGVEVVKAVNKDYRVGEVYDIFVPGHYELEEYLKGKYLL